MTSLLTSLWHETRGRFDRLPVWLPGARMELGDVGVFDDGGWVKHTTLDALGIPFTPDLPGVPTGYDYASHDGAQVSTWLAADGDPTVSGIAQGNAGLRIRFSRAGAFVLKADEVTVQSLANLADVDRRILARHRAGKWERGWVLVSEVARGGPAITVVSGSSDGEAFVDLGVTAAAAGQPLAAAGAGIALGTRRGLAGYFVSPTETTLLWRGRCVRDPWWSSKTSMTDRGDQIHEELPVDGMDLHVVEIEHLEDVPTDDR